MRMEGGLTTDKLFLIVAIVLIATGIGYAYVTAPTTLTIAVGPVESPETRLFQAFAQQLKAQRVALRLKVRTVANLEDAAKALDEDRTELAVIRPDIRTPENGLTVALMRDAALIVVAPEGSVADVSALSGKTIGVAAGHEADVRLVARILQHLDLDGTAVTIVQMKRDEVLPALKEGRIQAAAIVAPPTGNTASTFVRGLLAAYEGKLDVLSVDGADTLVLTRPDLVATTIPAGVWGARPKRPAEEVKTIGVSYRLMAHADMDRSTIAVLTEALFQMRGRLATVARSANLMRAPEMDTASSATSATLPNHPGAVDYFQRETQSVMDRYGDWIYLSAFFGSGVLSILAALQQRFRRRGREKIDDVLDRLVAILAEARSAETVARLEELTVEIDGLVSRAVDHARGPSNGARATTALVLALDGARSAIAERRRVLTGTADGSRRDGGPRLVTMS